MDATQNILQITESMVNDDLRPQLLSLGRGYLSDYQVAFRDDQIILSLFLDVPTLGEINVHYELDALELTFHPEAHSVFFTYQEQVKSEGNIRQNLLLKALKLQRGTLLCTLLNLHPLSGITANKTSCSVNLEQLMDFSKPLWMHFSASLLESVDQKLVFSFSIC